MLTNSDLRRQLSLQDSSAKIELRFRIRHMIEEQQERIEIAIRQRYPESIKMYSTIRWVRGHMSWIGICFTL